MLPSPSVVSASTPTPESLGHRHHPPSRVPAPNSPSHSTSAPGIIAAGPCRSDLRNETRQLRTHCFCCRWTWTGGISARLRGWKEDGCGWKLGEGRGWDDGMDGGIHLHNTPGSQVRRDVRIPPYWNLRPVRSTNLGKRIPLHIRYLTCRLTGSGPGFCMHAVLPPCACCRALPPRHRIQRAGIFQVIFAAFGGRRRARQRSPATDRVCGWRCVAARLVLLLTAINQGGRKALGIK